MSLGDSNDRQHFRQIMLECYEDGVSFEEASRRAITSPFTSRIDNLVVVEWLKEFKTMFENADKMVDK